MKFMSGWIWPAGPTLDGPVIDHLHLHFHVSTFIMRTLNHNPYMELQANTDNTSLHDRGAVITRYSSKQEDPATVTDRTTSSQSSLS